MRDFYSPKGHETIGDSDLLSKAKAVPRLKNDLAALSILLAGCPIVYPLEFERMVGWDMVWVILQVMGLDLPFILMV